MTFDGGATWKSAPAFDNESFGPVVLSGSPTVMFLLDKALRSTDFGRSWAPIPLPVRPAGFPEGGYGPARVRAVNPTEPGELIATGYNRIQYTIDGGQTWTWEPLNSDAAQITVDWQTRRIYTSYTSRSLDAPGPWVNGPSPLSKGRPSVRSAARGVLLSFHPLAFDSPFGITANKLYRSTDGGATLQEVGGWTGSRPLCEIVFSSSPATRVYASECESGRLHRSDDDGETWEQVWEFDGGYVGSLAIDAEDADRIHVVSTRGLLSSRDGGRNFSRFERASGAPGAGHSLYFDAIVPTRQWISLKDHERPVYRSNDGGATWTLVNRTHLVLGASRTRGNTLFGAGVNLGEGYYDRRFAVSTNGGASWSTKIELEFPTPEAFSIAFGQAPGHLFVNAVRHDYPSPPTNKLHMSTDDGDTFTVRTPPPVGVQGLAATSTGSLRLYAAGENPSDESQQLFESDDHGLTWRWVSTIPALRSPVDGAWPNRLSVLVVDPADPRRLFAGYFLPDYLLRSDDGGKHWTRATAGLGVGRITSLAFDPADSSIVYASQAGSGVYRSTDGGTTWMALDEGLADDGVIRVVPDPNVAGRIYAETNTGLFRSDLGSVVPAGRRRAIEFYHSTFNHYFVTAEAAEISALDAGMFAGWVRTGEGFPVADASAAGSTPVCRFFGAGFAPISSHFYTPFANECDVLRADPRWQFETIAFGLALADADSHGCPAGTRALRRLWNMGMSGAPNHRYTTSKWTFDTMIADGWVFEGYGTTLVFACVPY